jgi:propanediol dehydratase small subunit
MNPETVVLGFLGGLALVVSFFWIFRLPKFYRERHCAGNKWQDEFPAADKREVRRFLSVFAGAFGFRDRDKLKFRPDDRLLDIYNQIYPLKGLPDALELETLSGSLRKQYGIDLENLWSRELTLGELFKIAVKAQQTSS